jgi:hypothetical protein
VIDEIEFDDNRNDRLSEIVIRNPMILSSEEIKIENVDEDSEIDYIFDDDLPLDARSILEIDHQLLQSMIHYQ